jgi:hypothetical protein
MILLKCVLILFTNGSKEVYNIEGYANKWSEPNVVVDFYDSMQKLNIKADKTVYSVNSNSCLFVND